MAETGQIVTILPQHRTAIAAVRPDLQAVALTPIGNGWDAFAIRAGTTLFKFPVGAGAADRLRREPKFLDLMRPHVALQLPKMHLHETPMLMSEHEMVEGVPVDAARYAALGEPARAALADDLATFFIAAHAVPAQRVRAKKCDGVRAWPSPERLRHVIADAPGDVVAAANDLLARFARHPPDETVVGQFDTHGWNMAFDDGAERLNGLFDFAGSGIGPLHRDLSYLHFTSAHLAQAVVERYAAQTGRAVSFARTLDTHGALKVIELAEEMLAGAPITRFCAAVLQFAAERDGPLH
ncbi:MAG: phosphotransferase [Pseudomonadota bacterium]